MDTVAGSIKVVVLAHNQMIQRALVELPAVVEEALIVVVADAVKEDNVVVVMRTGKEDTVVVVVRAVKHVDSPRIADSMAQPAGFTFPSLFKLSSSQQT